MMASKSLLTLAFFSIPIVLAVVSIILGSIAWYRSSSLYLPIPVSLTAISTFLPLITLVIATVRRAPRLTTIQGANQANSRNWVTRFALVANELLVPMQTVIAVLAITYLNRGQLLSCRLNEQWQSYFHTKNSRAIRSIQDTLQCCGFRSTRDRAWPFNDANHNDDACIVRFGYQQSCVDSWEATERSVAAMVLAGAIISWMIKIFIERSRRDRNQTWMNDASITPHSGSNPRLLPFSDSGLGEASHEDADENNIQQGPQPLPIQDSDIETGWRDTYSSNPHAHAGA